MAVEQLISQVDDLSATDFMKLKEHIDEQYRNRAKQLEEERAVEMRDSVKLGDTIKFHAKGTTMSGRVILISFDGCQVESNDLQRKQTIKWTKIIGKA